MYLPYFTVCPNSIIYLAKETSVNPDGPYDEPHCEIPWYNATNKHHHCDANFQCQLRYCQPGT